MLANKVKNISDKDFNKEIIKYLNSFTKEEWLEKLEEEKRIFEETKLKEKCL